MSLELPSEIERIEPPEGGVLYRLPRRPSLVMRLFGLVPMLFGMSILSWPLMAAAFFLSVGGMDGNVLEAILLPLGCFGPICLPLGGFLFGIGLFTLFGHTEVSVRDGRLTSVGRCGWLRWGGSRPLERITGFHVTHTNPQAAARGEVPVWIADVGHLTASLGDGRTFTVCTAYPREWLLPLGDELARHCQREAPPKHATDVASVRVTEESLDPAQIEERDIQPTGSTAVLEERASGFTITIPRQGLRGCNTFGVIWTVFWNGMIAIMAPIFLWAAAAGEMKWQDGPERVSVAFMCLFLSPFILIGVGSLLWLVHQLRRSAVLDVEADRLEVALTGVFGITRYNWSREELEGVGVESKYSEGSEGGGSWETQLCVRLRDSHLVRLLGYRPKSELEWIATLLRKTLRIGDIPEPVKK